MKIGSETTLADIVSGNPSSAEIFEKYKIDFCCQGQRTLREACSEKRIPVDVLIKQLDLPSDEVQSRAKEKSSEWDKNNLDGLVRHIVENHHGYVRRMLPVIQQDLHKVYQKHEANHPELSKIADIFSGIKTEMEQHMFKEENILFPYINTMVRASDSSGFAVRPPFYTVRNPIQMMESEHQFVGDSFKIISSLSNHYQPPGDACTSFRKLYADLFEFEKDLHIHIHLENNILFPASALLEKELFPDPDIS